MKYNCLFDDADFNFRARLNSSILSDGHGYYLELRINRSDVIKLMELGVVPNHIGDGVFVLQVRLTNKSIITFNGLRLSYFNDEAIQNLDISKIIIKEICLRRYSKSTITKNNTKRQCYATRVIFTIPGVGISKK